MFYTLHVVEPLRYDSVLIKETNEWMNEWMNERTNEWMNECLECVVLARLSVAGQVTEKMYSKWAVILFYLFYFGCLFGCFCSTIDGEIKMINMPTKTYSVPPRMENSWDKEWGTSGGIPHYAGDPGSGMRSNRCITVLRIPFVSRNIFRVSISQQIWHESRINSTNNKKTCLSVRKTLQSHTFAKDSNFLERATI